jgi:Arc/MetJ-type ribon-helix-helix transcriptional regulator
MTTKIAVSLPDELVLAARAAVHEGRAASVSAYVAAALLDHTRREGLASLLADLDAELGPPDSGSLAFADRALGLDDAQ